jgi:hypothetical protein
MIEAGMDAYRRSHHGEPFPDDIAAIYSAMHAARPPMKVVRADPIVFEPDDASPNPEASEIMREALTEARAYISRDATEFVSVADALRMLNRIDEALPSICKGTK